MFCKKHRLQKHTAPTGPHLGVRKSEPKGGPRFTFHGPGVPNRGLSCVAKQPGGNAGELHFLMQQPRFLGDLLQPPSSATGFVQIF